MRAFGFTGIMLAATFCLTQAAAAADYLQTERRKPNTNVMAADALIGRPLGLGMTVLGTTAFVATLPFTIPSCSVRDAARGLVVEPARWTFKRPLGQRKDAGFMLP
jgi:hypothetical protein